MNLLRAEAGRPLVIGHRGAAALAAENTLASLEAAIAAGADIVEFDISPGLRLGHSLDELAGDDLSLEEALEFLGGHDVGLHLDVKLPGYEDGVLQALRRHRLEERAYVSTAFALTGRRIAARAPWCTVAIGYPRDRVGISQLRWPGSLTRAGAASLRRVMPVRVPVLLRWARADALSLHHTLCSHAVVSVAHRLGAPVLAWTANDPEAVRRLVAAKVDGIVSDDPKMALETLATLLAS